MEDQIERAKNIRSNAGIFCFIFSSLGVLASAYLLLQILYKNQNNNPYVGFIGLGSSIALGTLGSIATNQKRTAALTALFVAAQNSASQLPIRPVPEYSDLLEDSENK